MKTFISPDLLAENATSIHKDDVIRYYTEPELLQLKAELADATVQLSQRNSLVTDLKTVLKHDDEDVLLSVQAICSNRKIEGVQGIKSLTAFIANTSKAINTGHTTSYENVYVFADFDERRVGVYACTGHLLYERAMRPDEYQQSIFSLPKAQ